MHGRDLGTTNAGVEHGGLGANEAGRTGEGVGRIALDMRAGGGMHEAG